MSFVSSLLGLLMTRPSVSLDQIRTERLSRGLDITIGHPGINQDSFTWLTHCPLASGDIEINSKCCGLKFVLVLFDSRWQGRFSEGFSFGFFEGLSLEFLEGILFRFSKGFSLGFSEGISLKFLKEFSLGSSEGYPLGS
jgi:hypothetical protein